MELIAQLVTLVTAVKAAVFGAATGLLVLGDRALRGRGTPFLVFGASSTNARVLI